MCIYILIRDINTTDNLDNKATDRAWRRIFVFIIWIPFAHVCLEKSIN